MSLLVATLVATASGVVGCGRRQTRADELVVLSDVAPTEAPLSLDPRFTRQSYDIKLSRLIFAGLVGVDRPSLEPELYLAEEVTPVDPVTWDVTVRREARFADGSRVTALDVYETFRSIMADETKSSTQSAFRQRIRGLRLLPDPEGRRIRFHLKDPLATFITDLDMGILPAATIRRWGPDVPVAGMFGAGPYRLASWDEDAKRAVLEQNPHHLRGPGKLRRVVFRTVKEDSSRLLALIGGSGDLMQGSLPASLIPAVRREDALVTTTGPSILMTFLGFNHDDPIVGKLAVRKAVAHAIDRELIIRTKFGGTARLATGYIPPGHWAYLGEVTRYPFDLVRARQLLDEAGFPDPDGEGPRKRFTLVFKASNVRARMVLARTVAWQLEQAGIGIDLRVFEAKTLLADLQAGNYQLFMMQTGEIIEPDMAFAYYHSSRIPTAERKDVINRLRFRSAEMDQLTDLGRKTIGRELRIPIYHQVQRVFARELPVVPLWHEDLIVVQRRDVSGFVMLPNARYSPVAGATKQR